MKNEVQSGEEFPEKRCTQKPVAISDLTHKILETDKQYDLSKIVYHPSAVGGDDSGRSWHGHRYDLCRPAS